jgi:hypothetical protein
VAKYFEILQDASRQSNPETTRLAALRSLQTFSPTMKPSSPKTIPAFLTLFEFLSDDDFEIRQRASGITAPVLGEYMVSCPAIASEQLVQMIGETLDPDAVERALVPIICFDVRTAVGESLNAEKVLFAKERENLWRDEVRHWELYLCILSSCWTRQTETEGTPYVGWAEQGVSEIRRVVDGYEDGPLGWSSEIEFFEAVVKILLLCQELLKHDCGKGVLDLKLEELKSVMLEKKSHEYWIAKLEVLLEGHGAD